MSEASALSVPPLRPHAELTEAACLEWLWRARFSADGSMAHCRRCGVATRHHKAQRRRSWECQVCGNHIHPTAGTIFHGSRTPLTLWFRTIALVEAGASDLTARQLAIELAVTYKTAWRMLRAIRSITESSARDDDGSRIFRLAPLPEDWSTSGLAGRRRRSIRAAALRSRLGAGQLDPPGETHRRILGGACRAMARRGFAATRIEDIAREAGVSAPTIYRYFETKEDVLMAAVDWVDRDGTERREAILDADDDPPTKLARFLDLMVPQSSDVAETYALYLDLWARAARDGALRPMVERAEQRWQSYWHRLIKEGVRTGDFTLRRELSDTVEYIAAVSVGLALPLTLGFASMSKLRLRELMFRYATVELGISEGLLESSLRQATLAPR